MSDDPSQNPLALRSTAPARRASTALQPSPAAERAVPAMLKASVDAFGDVVSALLTDLDQAGNDITELAWLASTASLLHDEPAWRAAQEQLAFWERFLAGLPSPQLLSEGRREELRRVAAARARARVQGREAALAEHRRRVGQEMAAPDIEEARWHRLAEIYEDPAPGEWRVDVDAHMQAALDALPPAPNIVPIAPEDLLATHNFSGFNAVAAMREHPELAGRASAMDAALAGALRAELNLSRADAQAHATVMTNIFYIALRRALATGSHHLAASVGVLSHRGDDPVKAQFARELFESWVPYLMSIPARPSLAARVPLLGGLFGKKALPEAGAPRQLTAAETPPEDGAWGRLKRALGRDGGERG